MANPTIEVRSNDASDASVTKIDMKLEVVVIPVSDVDRAKEFYRRLGWRLDVDSPARSAWSSSRRRAPDARSISARPSRRPRPVQPRAYLIVSDIVAARNQLVAAGIEGERGLPRPRLRRPGRAYLLGAPGQRSGSRTSQLPLARLVQRSRRQRLAAAGDHDPASRAR